MVPSSFISHNSHTMVPRALQILSANRILAISSPSIHILQVHNLCIFGPLKKYFGSSLAQKKNGKIEDLHEIGEEPWVLATH